ncbi:MAG: hypothetical protein MUF07_08300 [Steroidobacteraceae bacterium]|jgi:hypothetical protein|nr:hypothetical protein [Steroidobacteraceae bacterium]
MRYLLGTACLAIALALLAGARAYRARVLARFDADEVARLRAEALKDPRSMASFGEIARPFIMFGLFYVAIKTTIAFVAFDATRTLSWLDLAGFHALLAGYGTWFTVRARYWLPQDAVARELDRQLEAHMRANPAPPVHRGGAGAERAEADAGAEARELAAQATAGGTPAAAEPPDAAAGRTAPAARAPRRRAA